MAGPADFATAPRHQPAGSSYNINDYGLFNDFKVLEITGDLQKYYIKKDQRLALRMAEPVVLIDKQHSNEFTKRIMITDTCKLADIYYTTDGSEPSIKSVRYKTAFDISKTSVIKAFAVKKEMLQSNVCIKNIVFGINIANAVYKNEYTKYNAGGNDGLYDNERGSENIYDGKWQGFEAKDMDICFELQKQQKINNVSVGFLENIGSWIYFPVKFEIYVSIDGINYQKAASLSAKEISDLKGDPIKDISIPLHTVEAKFVRIIAKNIEKCPEGDPGSGGKAWIFTDEVVIE
jgi:hexosaminidase